MTSRGGFTESVVEEAALAWLGANPRLAPTAPGLPPDHQPNPKLAISRRLNLQSAESRACEEPIELFHHCDRDRYEVDIVVERGADAVAGIEVKVAASVSEQDMRGLLRLQRARGSRCTPGVVSYDGEVGQGTLKMAAWSEDVGLPRPEILEIPGAVVVRFRRTTSETPRREGAKSGPSRDQAGTRSELNEQQVQVLGMAEDPKSLHELMESVGRANRTKFREQVLRPLLDAGLLERTIPDKPRSSKQRYRTTAAGLRRVGREPHS